MKVFEKAMRLLAFRSHSSHELLNKLRYKGFDNDEIQSVLFQLQLKGFLDDQCFARNYVRSRANAGFGPLYILRELKKRVVEEIFIHQALWDSAIDWNQHCYFAWQKKYNQRERIGSKEYAKQFRFLMYRGYSSESIHKVLSIDEYK